MPRVESGTSRAVLSLLAEARKRVDAQDLEGAGAYLERALRIEPRNAVIWHYLARLRLNQGREAEAASLAAKSNTLAGDNRKLRADNWRLIAFVRRSQGDEAGAQRAEAQAARYQ